MAWFVLYTKPQQEKKVAITLEKIGITSYCPCVVETKQWSDRIKKVETPLLKSYVLVQLEEKERARVFEVPGVVRYLFWLGKPAMVRDQEVATLRDWLNEEEATVYATPWQLGAKIVLASGAFKGQEAMVQSVKNSKVELVLTSLGVKLTLERASILVS
jgi:transcriptional antiterminator RfaH